MKQEMIGDVPGNVLGMMADLLHKLQHGVISPEELGRFLKKEYPFSLPRTTEELVTDQQNFYLLGFGREYDFSQVAIPKRRWGFDRLIIVPIDMTPQGVYDSNAEFECGKYTDNNLNDAVPTNERNPKNGTYAIWVRDVVEADWKYANKSAQGIKTLGIRTETLLERLIHGYQFFVETGQQLDTQNSTLCAGSRNSSGDVPFVRFRNDKLSVLNIRSDFADISWRAREVVS